MPCKNSSTTTFFACCAKLGVGKHFNQFGLCLLQAQANKYAFAGSQTIGL